jgi:16S rRNA (guanine527-N7)-methyltransferase
VTIGALLLIDPTAFDAADFQRATDVSRETLEKLTLYAALLDKWQKSINLISSKSLTMQWHRHFWDSAQLAPLIQARNQTLKIDQPQCVDLGTGAGFPGLVLAIMGIGSWTLVDSDQKKAIFLQEVARQTDVSVNICPMRIEALATNQPDLKADIITARACAPLGSLLGHTAPLLKPNGVAYFLKGKDAARELDAASTSHVFDARLIPSVTDPSANIIEIQNLIGTSAGG